MQLRLEQIKQEAKAYWRDSELGEYTSQLCLPFPDGCNFDRTCALEWLVLNSELRLRAEGKLPTIEKMICDYVVYRTMKDLGEKK